MLLTEWMRQVKWISPQRKLEWYPPFRAMRIRVLELAREGRQIRILLPLSSRTRNPGGSMFGGCMASLADPIPALICARVFPGYAVWTRRLMLDFRKEGRNDLELRFELDADREREIARQLAEHGRSNPEFNYGFYLPDGTLCARVENTVAIRSRQQSGNSGGALKRAR